MQTLKKFLQSFLPFIVFSILGIAVGYGVAKLLTVPVNQGAFVFWKSLNSPYKFTEIVDANSKTIWAQTDDGKIYYRNTRCFFSSNCNKWIETSVVNNDLDPTGWEFPMEMMASCQIEGRKFPKDLSGKVVECSLIHISGAEFGSTIYYALLENGIIRMWKHSSSIISNFLTYVYSTAISLVLSTLAYFAFLARSKKSHLNVAQHG